MIARVQRHRGQRISNAIQSRRGLKLIRAAARAACVLERLEQRQLLSASWTIDSSRTLQVTTDNNNNNSIVFASSVNDPSNLDLWDQSANVHYTIPLADFDRINVQMGTGDFNYASWLDQSEPWLEPLTKPANINLGGSPTTHNIMFLYTSGSATVSGDGQTGAVYKHVSSPLSATVTYTNTEATQLIGNEGPDYLDASKFSGDNLILNGGAGNDTLIGGTGNGHASGGGAGTGFFGYDGNDLIIVTGGHNQADGGAGDDTYIGGPGSGTFAGGDGNDTFIHGSGRDGFDGGAGNNIAYATAPSGTHSIVAGTWVGGGASPNQMYYFFDDNFATSFTTLNTQTVNIDAGSGTQDGIVPATPGSPYPDLLVAGIDPNLKLQITHLEPTVNAGSDVTLQNTTSLASTGSFRDIGDPTGVWTATVDYGDGSGVQPLAYNPSTIATSDGPAYPFNLAHTYMRGGTYTITVTVTDAEGDQGTDTKLVTIPVKTSSLSLSASAMFGGSATLTANLQANGSALAGETISFASADGTFLGTATTDASGNAVLSNVNIGSLNAGTYPNAFTASFAGDATDTPATASGALTVFDQNLQGMVWVDFNNDGNVDFGEQGIDGVSVTLTGTDDLGDAVSLTTQTANSGIYTFDHIRPGNYTITEGATPPNYIEGNDSLGTLGGDASVQDVFSNIPVGINQNGVNYNFGEQPAPGSSVSKGQAATMGFWQNKNGQALILQFGSIAQWLASTLPQTFGNLVFSSSQDVATLYQQQFVLKDKLDAQAMATALNVYATDASLGGNAAASYGFAVSTYGLGDSTWNIGSDGAAFNVANNSTLTVMQILLDWDQQNNKSDKGIRQLALDVFGGINSKGGL